MQTIRSVDLINRLSDIARTVVDEGEVFCISRPHNKNMVLLSETQFNEIMRSYNNMRYLEKIERAIEGVKQGRVVHKTLEELRAMEEE